ncbi:MAG: ABC transporter ATP-binding protein [Elusimicrobiota bacterium]|nr:ABC transporter ATP-binding protein/permease [Endomicrobiia bacterium]MDW8165308.1 ABC transporter ATP-binding protein [Elusimicrobiota bacterium]
MNKIKFLFPYIKQFTLRIYISFLCMFFVGILTSGSRWLVKPVVDKIFFEKNLNNLYLLVVIIPVVYLFIGIFTYIKNYFNVWIANNIVRKIREDLYKHLQIISIDYFITKSTTGHTLAKLTNDLNNIFIMLNKTPTVLITDIITLVGLIFVLFYISFKYAVLSLLVLPIALFPIYIFTKKLRHYSKKTQQEISNLYSNLQESISAIFLTQIFNQQKKEFENFKNFNDKVYIAIKKFSRIEFLSSPVMEFIGALGVGLVLLLGGIDVITNKWTPGSFFAFLATVLSFYQPLKRITEINPIVQQGLSSIERINEIFNQKPSVIEVSNPKEAKFNSEIVFKNVFFSYKNNSEYILKNLNIRIPKGKKIAIVGPSGAGKSTVLNLLLRFYDVKDGEILIDNTNIKEFSLSSLRKLFGVVTQETFLFNNTIWYNLTYANENAKEEEVIEATKLAHIYEFINNLPQKFNTVVGERGYSLSGGERQRIAIARALLKKPEVFIFDEPTSALDAESEAIVFSAMKNIFSTKTVILITHRLNLVLDFDYIYVFSNGCVVEEGKHEDLIKKNGFYASLINFQKIN